MLTQASLFISPEHFVGLVPCVFPKTCLGVIGAAVGLDNLVNGVVVVFLCLFLTFQLGGRKSVVGQSHEYAVEPHLIGIDSLVPPHTVLGAGLFFQLFEDSVQRGQFTGTFLLAEVIHAVDEFGCANIVEVEIGILIASHTTHVVDHLGRILLEVVQNARITISKIGVEHAFHLNAHHIAPLRFLREVEQGRVGHTLHLRGGQPLAEMLVRHVAQDELSVDKEIVEVDILCLTHLMDGFAVNSVEAAVVHVDIIHRIGQRVSLITHNHHSVFRLFAGHVVHVYIAYDGVESTTTHFLGLVVGIDFEHSLLAGADGDIAEVDVLNDAATARIGLDT